MIRNATQFVELVENRLGWQPPEGMPYWKAVRVEAGKVNRWMEKDPVIYTFDNLELAVELLYRERQPVKTPCGVFFHIERALKAAPVAEQTDDLDAEIDAALLEAADRDWPDWVERLTRARGDGRVVALEEFRQACLVAR